MHTHCHPRSGVCGTMHHTPRTSHRVLLSQLSSCRSWWLMPSTANGFACLAPVWVWLNPRGSSHTRTRSTCTTGACVCVCMYVTRSIRVQLVLVCNAHTHLWCHVQYTDGLQSFMYLCICLQGGVPNGWFWSRHEAPRYVWHNCGEISPQQHRWPACM